MNRETFSLWAKYNKAVNEKMNDEIKTISPGEWDKYLGGYFKSVRGLCSHLYVCDFNWLKRFSRLRDFAVLKEVFFDRELYSFSEVLFEDMVEYFAKRPQLDEKIIAFADDISEEDIHSILRYTDSHGVVYEKKFGGLIMQSFNHDSFHRGMLSLYLEMLGKENDFGSFGVVL
jgi:uncharacterized damage-inducible protein DinB